MNPEIAKAVLAKGKAIAPDRFPKPSVETAQGWAEALGGMSMPVELWRDAVLLWCTERAGDRMCTPKDLKESVYIVRDRWEADPRKAQFLAQFRAERLNRNYERMGLEPVPPDLGPDRALAADRDKDERVLAETRRRAQNGNQTRNEQEAN